MEFPRLKADGGPVASLIVKASVGILYWVQIYNNNAAVRYLHIFDSATLPVNGTIPNVPPYSLPATGAAIQPQFVDLGEAGLRFQNGIVIANSTTQTTLTIGSADSIITVAYV